MSAKPEVGIGIVGYGLMGRAHAYGYAVAPRVRDLPCAPRLLVMSGRDAGAVVRGVEGRLGQFYVSCNTRQMHLLEGGDLHGARERCVADPEVEHRRHQTVHAETRIVHEQPEHALRFGVEQPA